MTSPSDLPVSEARLADALRQCAQEPVHIPGAIQPGGCLLSLDAECRQIRQVSANLGDFLGVPPEQALDGSPRDLLGDDLVERIRHLLDPQHPIHHTLTADLAGPDSRRRFQVTTYRSGSRVVVELEPLTDAEEHHLLGMLNRWLVTVADAPTSEQLLQQLVDEVYTLTGLDRVMVYRFDERWNGSVVAERRNDTAESFFDHHFPASDIPPQVRRLYDINRLRSIPDATAPPVPLVPAVDPVDAAPLDLSRGLLRAVSPVHQTYLANMGVKTALSVALHDDEERLSGLLSCHGLANHPLSPSVRDTVRALVQVAVPQLMLLQAKADNELMQRVQLSRDLLNPVDEHQVQPASIVAQRGDEWLSLFRADGVALHHRQRSGTCGKVPDVSARSAIVDWLNGPENAAAPWYSHALSTTPLAEWRGTSCGLLAIPLPIDTHTPSWLLLFRDEENITRRWAGSPQKPLDYQDNQWVLSPRRSFAEWQEKVRDQAKVWRRNERRAARDLAENLAALIASHEIHLLNARLHQVNERLERLATQDSLTDVWNRYRIEQSIEAEIASATRYQRDSALLLFDVDHFKAINDKHGHEIGDKVLKTLVTTVQAGLRDADHLGRWGGEEFVVLATGTSARGAEELAERLRQRVADTCFEAVGQVTVSIGIATYQPGDTTKTLVKRADQAMYAAKQTGRNCIHCAD
ncbi:sensor domain-containing diguanylate cyclase [Halomonas sp. NO4]|uniref:sensor domain-containing diguanylate cyclase n=1 Tax=Halomonas sp. NO4 TaxID=2484813 RepID=UPI0013D850BA|nr:sensor domain-containing diguanylate cyclase [Halomonas sp. NO4]